MTMSNKTIGIGTDKLPINPNRAPIVDYTLKNILVLVSYFSYLK